MNDNGVRPRKLSHWAGLAIVIATVWHNPGGSAELAITTLDGIGTGLGWMLDRGGMDGDSHYFEDPAVVEEDPEPGDASYQVDGNTIRTGLDAATGVVLGLHDEVEGVQDNGGFIVEVGDPANERGGQ